MGRDEFALEAFKEGLGNWDARYGSGTKLLSTQSHVISFFIGIWSLPMGVCLSFGVMMFGLVWFENKMFLLTKVVGVCMFADAGTDPRI